MFHVEQGGFWEESGKGEPFGLNIEGSSSVRMIWDRGCIRRVVLCWYRWGSEEFRGKGDGLIRLNGDRFGSLFDHVSRGTWAIFLKSRDFLSLL